MYMPSRDTRRREASGRDCAMGVIRCRTALSCAQSDGNRLRLA